MAEMREELKGLMKTARDFVSSFARSEIVQDEAAGMIEGFFYANIIVNFRKNLTGVNMAELKISEQESNAIDKKLGEVVERCEQALAANDRKLRTNAREYELFKKQLKFLSNGSHKLLLGIEKEVDFKGCVADFKKLRRDISKMGKEQEGDVWFGTLIVESMLLAGQDPMSDSEMDKVAEDLARDSIPEMAREIVPELKRRMPGLLRQLRKDGRSFEKRLAKRWKKPLDLLEAHLHMAFEVGVEFNEKYREEASRKNDLKFEVLTRIHARACQVAWEILILLKSGLADGAHARWRCLYELAVISFFITEHGQNAAGRFMEYEAIESYKEALEYNRQCSVLGFDPISQDEINDLEEEKNHLCRKYGKDFGKGYGWAAVVLKKKRVTFADIEKSVDLDHFRPFYKMACNNVHAGPKGMSFRLGLVDDTPLLLAGPSNYGLADPGQQAAISLQQVTVSLVRARPNFDHLIMVGAMLKWGDELGEAFLGVQKQIEDEERVLRKGV